MGLTYESFEKTIKAFKDVKVFRVRPTPLVDAAYVLSTERWRVALVPPEWLKKAPELEQSLITQEEWERFLDDWAKRSVLISYIRRRDDKETSCGRSEVGKAEEGT